MTHFWAQKIEKTVILRRRRRRKKILALKWPKNALKPHFWPFLGPFWLETPKSISDTFSKIPKSISDTAPGHPLNAIPGLTDRQKSIR